MQMMTSSRCLLALAGLIVLAGCASSAPPPTLYDRLGGLPALTAVVDKTMDSAASDPRTSRSFQGIKVQGLKESIVEQLCEATGGPCKYRGATMRKSHEDLEITSVEFDAFAQQLVAVLDQFKVGTREKDDLLQILGPMKRDIVTK